MVELLKDCRRAHVGYEMKKVIFYILLLICIAAIPFFILSSVGVMVSIKYEAEYTDGCTSAVDRRNLCLLSNIYVALILIFVAGVILLIYRRKYFFDKRPHDSESNEIKKRNII